MELSDPTLLGFVIALGIGLLIGIDRERHKGEGPTREAAGVRTFTLTALAGAAAGAINSDALMAAVAIGVVGLAALSYWRSSSHDPGLTGEIALVTTVLLGMLTMSAPTLAAGAGVVVAVLLYSREGLHHFVRSSLTEAEMRDALIFAGATLVVLPLLPDDPIDPYGVLNLRKIWIVVVLIMAIGGAGYIAVRLLGVRFGLPASGFASGFVSSSATIAAMASRVKETPGLLKPAAAGAVLSTVATIVQLAVLLAAVNLEVLGELALPLALSGLAAVLYGGAFTLWALKHEGQSADKPGRAFSLATALILAGTLAVILVASAALQSWLGEAGLVIAAGTAGFADTHSAAVSAASLATADRINPDQAVLPILAAFSTNTITKIVLAFAGNRAYALGVVPGLVLVAAAAWLGFVLEGGTLALT